MGEENTDVRFGFNGSVRVAARGEQLSGNAGAMLLRAVDDSFGVTAQLARELDDPRDPALVQHPVSELLRTRLQMIALGYRDQGDADLLRRDPALLLAVSDASGLTPLAGALASQPTMSRLVDSLASSKNLVRLNRALLDGAVRCGERGRGLAKGRATIDVDSFPIAAHGQQPGSAWNGHYYMRCFHPLIAMLDTGHWLGVELRPGNTHTAKGVTAFLDPILAAVKEATGEMPRVRGDSGFVNPATLDDLEARGVDYVFRVNNNKALDRLAQPLLVRPPGRRPIEPREWVHDIEYRSRSWSKPRRVVIVVIERKDELFLHHFVLVTNASRKDWPAARLLADYRQRGTMEARLGEMQSVLTPALSCTPRADDRASRDPLAAERRNAATLLLFALAYNLAHSTRVIHARATKQPCALDRLRKQLLAVPALILVSARRATFALNAGIVDCWARFLRTLAVPKTA